VAPWIAPCRQVYSADSVPKRQQVSNSGRSGTIIDRASRRAADAQSLSDDAESVVVWNPYLHQEGPIASREQRREPMAKKKIGNTINTVTVEYGSGADNKVNESLINVLKACIKSDIAEGATLNKIYVSATTNGKHSKTSRHYSGKAIDISRVNGKRMSVSYPDDTDVKKIVDAIQVAADGAKGIRENFGPHFKHKHGKKWSVSGHKDHIHLSVD